MVSIIPGYEYNFFISYRQKIGWEKGGTGEGERPIQQRHPEAAKI